MIRPLRGTDGNQFQHNFKNSFLDDAELSKPTREVGNQVAEYTKKQIESIVYQRTGAAYGRIPEEVTSSETHFVKYTPKQSDESRIIKMQAVKQDPMEPARFKHKRIPKGPGSPPPILMRSPPRKLTVKDQLDWKIPPCISNWKNAKGYTIPLEMRLSADGRALQHYTVNSKFAQLTDGLYIAERQSRKELEERNKILKSLAYKEQQDKEEEARRIAALVRQQKANMLQESVDIRSTQMDDNEKKEQEAREELRYIKKREIEREMRMKQAGKTDRDEQRDISEKVALGQAQPTSQELLFDQRLFNQSSGLNAGNQDDEEYDVYSKPLFHDRSKVSLYKDIKKLDDDEEEGQKNIESLIKKSDGDKKGRSRPVEFEKQGGDIFGMDSFVVPDNVVKKVKKS